MKCPKCAKKLELIKSKGGSFYGHGYTLSDIMNAKKPICDYSEKVNK